MLTLQQKLRTAPEVMRVVKWQMDSIRLEQQPPSHPPSPPPLPRRADLSVPGRRWGPGTSSPPAAPLPRAGQKGALPLSLPSSQQPCPASRSPAMVECSGKIPLFLTFPAPRSRRAGAAGIAAGALGLREHNADSASRAFGHRCCRPSSGGERADGWHWREDEKHTQMGEGVGTGGERKTSWQPRLTSGSPN